MENGYSAKFYPFDKKPLSDTCWSLSTGPDGKIYASACVERIGGHSVTVVRYDDKKDGIEYLFDVADVCGDPPDSGRATQCKIHYSFAPSPSTGIMYCATHLSGPPKGEDYYCPWSGWHDKKRSFLGAMLVAYDTKKDSVAWSSMLIPQEGCRCLALDDERGLLYALSYPRDHFIVYDLATRKMKDMGRISSVNCQCIFLDRKKRAYFTDDQGRFNRYSPDTGKLERLPLLYPHAHFQTGWHGVLYDAVNDANGESVFMLPWMVGSRLARFWPDDGPYGRVEDLGRVTQDYDATFPIAMHADHAGGLVMGIDGQLYFVRSAWEGEVGKPRTKPKPGVLFANDFGWGEVVRYDINAKTLTPVCRLERKECSTLYVSRGGRDNAGNLYFGHIGVCPTGLFRMTVPGAGKRTDAHNPVRMWG